MELKEFLEALLEFGLTENYFQLTKIKNLDKSCCTKSNVEVVDFDLTKDIFCKQMVSDSLKSADGLKILIDDERIDFIEMKSMKEYLKFQFDKDKDATNQIINKVETFDLYSKYFDSYHILYQIIRFRKFLWKKKSEIFCKININFILLTDIEAENDPIDFIAASLDFLSETSSDISNIFDILNQNIDSHNFPKINKLNKPILKNCSSIEQYYEI